MSKKIGVYLSGDRDKRNTVGVSCRQRRDQVRCTWTGGRHTDRSFSGDAGIAACGVSGRLLLTDKDMLDGSGII